jgi:Tfp pilus assembly protein PilF
MIAEKEIQLRPTAQSYSLLAYTYLKDGDMEKALAIVDDKILGHTHEPEPLLIAALVWKESHIDVSSKEQYKELKSELLDSSYELGPIQEKLIKAL